MHSVHQQFNHVEADATGVLPNGMQSFQSTAPQEGRIGGHLPPNETTYISTDEGCRKEYSSVAPTLEDTQRNPLSEVLVSLPSSSGRGNEQTAANGTSPSTPSTLKSCKPQENDNGTNSSSSSEESTSCLSSEDTTLHPASLPIPSLSQTEREREAHSKSDSEVSSEKDTLLGTDVSKVVGDTSQSSPVLPVQELKQPEKPKMTTNSATDTATEDTAIEEEDECTETCLTTPNGDSSSGSSPHECLQTRSGTPERQSDREDEACQFETNDTSSSLKPLLAVEESDSGIVLSWDLPSREEESKVIKYELFVMSASTEETPSSSWSLLGVVDALALPMACTMNQFLPGASYFFTVRAITENSQCGLFSDPCSVTMTGPQ